MSGKMMEIKSDGVDCIDFNVNIHKEVALIKLDHDHEPDPEFEDFDYIFPLVSLEVQRLKEEIGLKNQARVVCLKSFTDDYLNGKQLPTSVRKYLGLC